MPVRNFRSAVDQFIEHRFLEMGGLLRPLLEELAAIGAKAKKPGVAIGKQLSPDDIERFNTLRHLLIQGEAERVEYSKFLRDVHVIAETLQVARLADLYEVTKADLGDADPRQFYFTILESIRIAQPEPYHTPLIDTGIECDPEGGLFFEESFNQQQLGKGGLSNQHLVNLIGDIERLRTFYRLIWMRFDKGISDIRATTWIADMSSVPDTLEPAIATASNSMQQMWRAIIPYIDKQMRSEKEFEVAYQKKFKETMEREYPSK